MQPIHKQRVLFVQPVLAPYSVPRYKELAKSNRLEVHIALETGSLPSRPGWVPRDIEGCEIHVLDQDVPGPSGKQRNQEKAKRRGKAPFGLVGLIMRLKPAAVVVCNPTQFLLALVARPFHQFRIGLLLEDSPLSESRKNPAIQLLRKRVYRRADFCFYFSEDAKQYADQIGLKSRFYRTSWSIDPAWLDNKERTGHKEKLRYLYVGGLLKMKGTMELLDAWKDFSSEHGSVELCLVGEGPLYDSATDFCRKHSLKNVTFTGQLPYEAVRDQYMAADIFVLPTHQDLFSLVVTEAMSFRLPVLTTIYNGARELVKDGWNGYIFDSHDKNSFLKALNASAADRDRLAEMGMHSYEVIGEYTHEKVMSRMREHLETELASGNKHPAQTD